MTKKEIRKTKTISMSLFLELYYGVDESDAKKLGLHSHKTLKQIAKLYGVILSKISFDNLTKEMLARGEAILVEDIYRNAAPYINPNIEFVDEYETTMDERFVSHEVYEGDEKNDKHKTRRKVK